MAKSGVHCAVSVVSNAVTSNFSGSEMPSCKWFLTLNKLQKLYSKIHELSRLNRINVMSESHAYDAEPCAKNLMSGFVEEQEYYEKDGKQLPGSKGIALPPDQWNKLVEGLPTIAAALPSRL